MTKDVLVKISGLQIDVNSDENIEIVTPGQYYIKNNKHYALYDEYVDDSSDVVTKNTLKITKDRIEITKKGLSNVQMIFEENKETMSYYDTLFGSFLVGISTSQIILDETEDNIKLFIQYALSVNNNRVSDCNISILISSI